MRPGVGTRTKVAAIGLGALLTPVLLFGAANAYSDDGPRHGIPAIPPVAPVQSVVLAHGSAGEFGLAAAGVDLEATEPTDVFVVRVTLQPRSSTGWHRHAGPSMVVVASGTERLIEPKDHHGCTEETFTAGTAFAHPADLHNVANDSAEPVVVYITYFVPEGSTPALIPADPPRGC